MKRFVKIVFILLGVLLIPAGIMNAQEKKSEQHLKIVVAGKSGEKVELDTLIIGPVSTDSIRLKNGEVIILAKHDGGETIKHIGDKNGNVFVSVISEDDGEKGKNMTKEITIISSDSADIQHISKEGNVIVMKSGKRAAKEGKEGNVVTWSSTSSSSSSSSSSAEKTKYVIAKDGIVVSIEGNDETRVKELVKDIETKLGVSRDEKDVKNVSKEETKKTKKK